MTSVSSNDLPAMYHKPFLIVNSWNSRESFKKTEDRKEKQSKTKPETGFGPSLARLKRSRPYSLWYEKEMKETYEERRK